MNQILLVVHQETSNPGLVGEKLRSRGYQLDIRCPALGDLLPKTMSQHKAAIVFGGPMSANDDDTLPFIRTELDWIPTVLSAAKPYLGICLGAQLLARVLGANVSPHPEEQREIGYFDLFPTPAGSPYIPEPMAVYHWHREGFTIPAGAVKLAEGDTFPNQAFCYQETAFGLQFHPEMTSQLIDEWTTRGAEQLTFPGAHPRELHFLNHERFSAVVDDWLDNFLQIWLDPPAWKNCWSA
ncbi:MAG: glutamine amidotransferase [Leptolyngbya sp. SIO1D8]|nr:glutamine amidotransferase [Leptolyngbya sp. SIO1D8]